MKTPALRFTRSLALACGATGLLALASCMDRDPAGPSIPGPQFVAWSPSEPCSATGGADIDGLLNEPDWFDACTSEFIADLPGANTTHVFARFMDDGTKAYFSAISDRPFSAPNDVLRIYLKKDGAIHAIGFLGGSASQWTCTNLDTCVLATAAPTGATGVRRNFSGGTTYELEWPLASLLGGLQAEDIVDVRWEAIPGGSALRTLYPAPEDEPLQLRISGEGVEDNDPSLPDIIITTTAAVTVTIRDPDRDPVEDPTAFQCKISQPAGDGVFVARFNDLPEGSEWVGTAGNKKTCNHFIWPPLDPKFEPDFDLPGLQGAVFVEDEGPPLGGSSASLTWSNWLTAKDNAVALRVTDGIGEVREWHIEFQGPGRVATCSVVGDGTTVYAMEPGDDPRIPLSPNQPPPGLGLTYAPRSNCRVNGLSSGTTLLFQMRNEDGSESTGSLGPDDERVTLFKHPDLQNSTVVGGIEEIGDGSPVDLRTMIFGVVENTDNPQLFGIFTNFRGWNARKREAQIDFEVVLNWDTNPQTLKVKTVWKNNQWSNPDVQPKNQAARVKGVSGSFDTSTLEGGVTLLLDWTGISSAQIRVLANLSDAGRDHLPNSDFAVWPGDNGGSLTIRF